VGTTVSLPASRAIVLAGPLYPRLPEASGVRVWVGPPYFNPVGAIFFMPMLLVLAIGPLLRWRRDSLGRVGNQVVLVALVIVAVLAGTAFAASVDLLPLLGIALAAGVAVASFLPLKGRSLRRLPLATWGMVFAHFGLAVALFGAACDSAFTQERLLAAKVGETARVGPWEVTLQAVEPGAGPNWTALEGRLAERYRGGGPVGLAPQSRSFWAPPQETSESALLTRWNGQLYAVIGDEGEDGRWQLRLWWKPFVTLIWYGGLLIGLGGLLALIGRVASDLKRRHVRSRMAVRRAEEGA